MRIIVTLIFTLTMATLNTAFAQGRKSLIVGGSDVLDPKEVPFMVRLDTKCGGTLISDQWILTAAHCLTANTLSYAKAGMILFVLKGHKFSTSIYKVHPDYDPATNRNDIGVIKLTNPINWKTTGLRPIKLATPMDERAGIQKPGLMATAFGWGYIAEGTPNPIQTLKKVRLPIVSSEVANSVHALNGIFFEQVMIAAGYSKGDQSVCSGDSGGPLIVYEQDGAPKQIGVISASVGCGRPDKYAIYTKVSSAFDWIMQATGLDLN